LVFVRIQIVEKEFSNLENFSSLKMIGKMNLTILLKPGAPKLEIKGPKFRIDKFEAEVVEAENPLFYSIF
jgi:hypothetical protein